MKDDFFETNDIHFLLYCIVKFMEREKRRIPMSLKSVFRGYDRSLKTIQPGFLSDIYIYLNKSHIILSCRFLNHVCVFKVRLFDLFVFPGIFFQL